VNDVQRVGALKALAGRLLAIFPLDRAVPIHRHDNQAATYLHHRKRNTKKVEYVRADEVGTDHQQKAVQRDAPRERPPKFPRISLRHR
jgi:hypothetical protein